MMNSMTEGRSAMNNCQFTLPVPTSRASRPLAKHSASRCVLVCPHVIVGCHLLCTRDQQGAYVHCGVPAPCCLSSTLLDFYLHLIVHGDTQLFHVPGACLIAIQHQLIKHLILIGIVLLWLLESFAGLSYLLLVFIPIVPLLDPVMTAVALPDHSIHLLVSCNAVVFGQEHNADTASPPPDNGKFSVLLSPAQSFSKSLSVLLPMEGEERI
ncbi:hypothetical protein U9M48_001256 [Paspalum notatum var. saurae]|uniref:Uncharacterized protein n=1 Tax=Paspalum notatum var. saurae TaxID=547442 RepID=A0AAQ3PNB5_PASNO